MTRGEAAERTLSLSTVSRIVTGQVRTLSCLESPLWFPEIIFEQATDVFRAQQRPSIPEEIARSLSLVGAGRTLDLIFPSVELYQMWLKGLTALLSPSSAGS